MVRIKWGMCIGSMNKRGRRRKHSIQRGDDQRVRCSHGNGDRRKREREREMDREEKMRDVDRQIEGNGKQWDQRGKEMFVRLTKVERQS